MVDTFAKKKKLFERGQPELNWWPLDLQSNALPLSYTPLHFLAVNHIDVVLSMHYSCKHCIIQQEHWLQVVCANNINNKLCIKWKMLVGQCHDREFTAISAVTRIRTWVVSATTRSTNHYTITANTPTMIWTPNDSRWCMVNPNMSQTPQQ